ncbi:uncharacterized protein MELLADRAFT_106399 [Melampsora larici-populina 98AG31]|uniref:CxC1-like cysteine cluster associated with KDZ transposases domain-containing protein n=1 Tax=Melampsora larici-populina (strain 98AG31 / pathotype 3-4-7) TaxID=747676 RepID=F4RL95_MELLP|nr:uncharacterized protein MELLADRAFT_106399 [Melampsora larici-populina 98AG31]EGG06909.1 hypothetical protein MELLADRAFT_106399 [Melampsora larici-populina 98AG31]
MVLPGSLIPDSNKRQRENSGPAKPPPGSASKRLARLLEREAAASQSKNARLEQTSIPTPPIPNDRDSVDEDDQPQEFYHDLQLTGVVDDIAPVNNGTEIHPPGLQSAYFKSVTYQERTLTSEANWKKIIPDLFNSFMMCSLKTRQWGDEATWNSDFNQLCACPSWKKSRVDVDVIDLTKTILHLESEASF